MQDAMDIDPPPSLPLANTMQTSKSKDVRPASAPPYNAVQQTKEKMKQTGYVYDPTMMAHVHLVEDHPEQPERINIIYKEMTAQGLKARMKSLFFGTVTRQHAILVHSEDHWDKVEQIARKQTTELLSRVQGLIYY
jgi:histone deacetylase 6